MDRDVTAPFEFQIKCLSFADLEDAGGEQAGEAGQRVVTGAEEVLVGQAEQHVAAEEGGIESPADVDGGAAASGWGVVHDVIMDEGEVVRDFDGAAGMQRGSHASAHRLAGEEEED
jgi:hypothetical protein